MPVLNVSDQKIFKAFETVELYFRVEFKMTFSFLSFENKEQNICCSGQCCTTCEPLYMDINYM